MKKLKYLLILILLFSIFFIPISVIAIESEIATVLPIREFRFEYHSPYTNNFGNIVGFNQLFGNEVGTNQWSIRTLPPTTGNPNDPSFDYSQWYGKKLIVKLEFASHGNWSNPTTPQPGISNLKVATTFKMDFLDIYPAPVYELSFTFTPNPAPFFSIPNLNIFLENATQTYTATKLLSFEIIDQQTNLQQETLDYLQDDTPPNSDAGELGNVTGIFPPGPLDSLLNIPFKVTSVVISSLGGTCNQITAPLPFVNQDLTIPCFREILYDGKPAQFINLIGLIPCAFILINYFKHLYKKIERATSMTTTTDDEWGVI